MKKKAPAAGRTDGRKPQPAKAPEPAPPIPAVYAQTSRRHKVMAAVQGDDEFSVFSVSPNARKKDPVEVNPDARPREQKPGGGKVLRFFRGFFGG